MFDKAATQEKHIVIAILIAFLAVAIRLVFVFLMTDYSEFLLSDMLGYWERAHIHLSGEGSDSIQWMVQPPAFHIFLAQLLKISRLVGLWDYRLEAILVVQSFMGAISVYFLFFLVREIFRSLAVAISISSLYALTFPLIYLNAFVLTENFSIPLLIIAAYYLLKKEPSSVYVSMGLLGLVALMFGFGVLVTLILLAVAHELHRFSGGDGSLTASGALLATSIIFRPAMVLFSVPFFIFATFKDSNETSLRSLASILVPFLAIAAMASLYNSEVSDGRVRGLGANGGVGFYLAQCRVDRLFFQYEGREYWIVPPATFANEQPNVVTENVPSFQQGYYYLKGVECMRGLPDVVGRNFRRIGELFSGSFHPSPEFFRTPAWSDEVLSVFYLLVFGIAAALLLVSSLLFLRKINTIAGKQVLVFSSIVMLIFALSILMVAEQRYLMPGIFALYICGASGLLTLSSSIGSRDSRRH